MLLIDNMKVLQFAGHGDHEGHTCRYSFKVKTESEACRPEQVDVGDETLEGSDGPTAVWCGVRWG